MNDSKNFLTSKTIWGIIMMLVSILLQKYWGVTVTDVESGQLTTSAQSITSTVVGSVGTLLAIYGRVKATKKVKLLK